MDRLSDMMAFVTTVRAGSFAAAAKTMRVSAQRVGKQVAALEARLGAQLIVRTTRRQSLTEIGRSYFERCCVVLEEAALADALVAEYGTAPKGELAISAPYTFGTMRLAPFLSEYMARHPGVRIRLELSDRNVDVVDNRFDAAIRIGVLEDSSLKVRRLRSFRLAACASPGYVAAHGWPQSPRDLVGHECLIYTYALGHPLTQWRFERAGVSETIDVSGRLWINDGRAVIEAALSGLGVALQDENILLAEVARGRLVHLLSDWTGLSREVSLIYPANRHMPPKLRSFIDELMLFFGPDRGARRGTGS